MQSDPTPDPFRRLAVDIAIAQFRDPSYFLASQLQRRDSFVLCVCIVQVCIVRLRLIVGMRYT
jgi:hypothetical protein